jgi:hypothetical protein
MVLARKRVNLQKKEIAKMKETLTLWSVPVAAIPFVTNALEEYASRELFQQHYKAVEDAMYCIQRIREDYDDVQAQYAMEVREDESN